MSLLTIFRSTRNRYLLWRTMHKTNCTAADRLAEVQALFGGHFELERTEEQPPANAGTAKHLNSVFHFVRKSM